MQFPESWLRQYCDPPLDTQALAETLTMAGFEVESLKPAAPPFTGVVVAQIDQAEPHPNADRLRVCQVSTGTGETLQIVCGAPNAQPGLRVPLATVGAQLPAAEPDGAPWRIKEGKLRGVVSQGMLCSGKELGLGDDHSGLLELAADAPLGQDIRQWLSLDDTVFELKLTPNLAHGLSIVGVARELSALTGAPLKQPTFAQVATQHEQVLSVKVKAADLCGRFTGRVIRNVNPQAVTPAWMVQRLLRCGQRPVSPLVDISNYVMFELGRPSHIFDLDRIDNHLEVRWGKPGEQLKLLNGNTITVDEQVGVIADASQLESLAGIMGGDATAVGDNTQHVYVEAAFWWPAAVMGRARRYNFSTDAAHRFERGVDPASTVDHVHYLTSLIVQICGGEPGPIDDQVVNLPPTEPVPMRVSRASQVLGLPLTLDTCKQVFARLDVPCQQLNDDTLSVTPPSWRFDLTIEEDLIEEVARLVGYNQLPDSPPLAPVVPRTPPESRRHPMAVRRALADMGYQETINYSFVDEAWETELHGNAEPVRLLNPIASHMGVMRSSLWGGLLQVLRYNLDRRADRARVFEVGRLFLRDASVQASDTTVAGYAQPMSVAGLAYGPCQPMQWGSADGVVDFYDVKADVERLLVGQPVQFKADRHPALHPGRCAGVWVGATRVGVMGELHPRWRQHHDLPHAPVLFELALPAVQTLPMPQALPIGRNPRVWRDVALWVAGGVQAADVLQAARQANGSGLLQDVVLFDIYRPPAGHAEHGQTSMALRMVLGSPTATLTDEQADAAVAEVQQALVQHCQARLRV